MTSKNLPMVNYHWDFGDGTPLDSNPSPTHTYATPGNYTLSVLYQSIGSDTKGITVKQSTQPNFEIWACAGNKASIKVTDNNYDQYVIDFTNDGIPGNETYNLTGITNAGAPSLGIINQFIAAYYRMHLVTLSTNPAQPPCIESIVAFNINSGSTLSSTRKSGVRKL